VSENVEDDSLLQVCDLGLNFGGVKALQGVSLTLRAGEIAALIGPNGAGKTSFFNCLTGLAAPSEGSITLRGADGEQMRLMGLKPNSITEKGVVRTFQNIRLFRNMSVLENVMIGRHCRTCASIFGAIMRHREQRQEEDYSVTYSYALLHKLGLAKQANELAGNLPYGAQRRLEIARALATEPLLLLLDEPAAGMNPSETADLDRLIQRIQQENIAILLIEHDMKLVMSISQRIFVMDYGRIIASGAPQEVRSNPEVIKAYLGEEQT